MKCHFIFPVFIALLFSQCTREHKTAAIASYNQRLQSGVVVYDSAFCMNGVNINTGYQFVDMQGNVLKKRQATLCVTIDSTHYAGLTSDDQFALFENDSIVWQLPIIAHHAVLLDERQNLVVLASELIPYQNMGSRYFPVLYTINLNGEVVAKHTFTSLADVLKNYLPVSRDSILKRNRAFVHKHFPAHEVLFDSAFFHFNAVQIIPANKLEGKHAAFIPGNLLVSDYLNNFMAVLDRKTLRVLWFYFQPESYMGQHGPEVLPDGRISYFVNNLSRADSGYYSAARILNPLTGNVEWEYNGSPAYTMHSITQGSCQYLPNGNMLITINNRIVNGEGYVIEVTPDGKVVWKWVPPDYKEMSQEAEGFFKVLRQPY